MSNPPCYTVRMMIKEDKRQATYELWYLGDFHESGVKGRETFDSFLVKAGSLLQICRDEKIGWWGGVEIVEVSPDGKIVESVWSMNVDEFEKVSR